MKTEATRRAVMAGLAAAPVAGLPALAQVVAQPDPIFAAIERHKAAQAAYDACDGDDDETSNRLFLEEFDARNALAETPCASVSELLAKLKYLLEHESRVEGRRPDERDDFGSILVAIDIHLNGAQS
jgi:hypothetical protein